MTYCASSCLAPFFLREFSTPDLHGLSFSEENQDVVLTFGIDSTVHATDTGACTKKGEDEFQDYFLVTSQSTGID